MSKVELRHLRTLLALRNAGSLVEAAERLFLTQSAKVLTPPSPLGGGYRLSTLTPFHTFFSGLKPYARASEAGGANRREGV